MLRKNLIPAGIIGTEEEYWQRLKSLYGSSLIGYWINDEASGTVAIDRSGVSGNGTHANVSLAQVGIGDGKTSGGYNGTTSRTDIYSTGLNTNFNGNSGAMSIYANASNWADATFRVAFQIFANGSNFIRTSIQSGIVTFHHMGGGITKAKTYQVPTGLSDFIRLTMTWGGGEMIYYVNDNPISNVLAGLGTFTGSLNSGACFIGTQLSTTANWNGLLAHCLLLNRPSTPDEMLVTGLGTATRYSFFGDSISVGGDNYPTLLAPGFGRAIINNHAVGGAKVMPNSGNDMDTQIEAAAGDRANVAYILLGTNDDNAGDMVAFQSKYESNIVSLRTSNPDVVVKCVGVPPRWTDSSGGTPVNKENIRTAEKGACVSQSVTYIDMYDDPVFLPSDTGDGIHPNVVGSRKMSQRLWIN